MDEHITLKEYFESLLREHEEHHRLSELSLSLAREELNHWKATHNSWQEQMKDAIRREEFYRTINELTKKNEEISNLVYKGVGIALVIPIILGVITLLLKK